MFRKAQFLVKNLRSTDILDLRDKMEFYDFISQTKNVLINFTVYDNICKKE